MGLHMYMYKKTSKHFKRDLFIGDSHKEAMALFHALKDRFDEDLQIKIEGHVIYWEYEVFGYLNVSLNRFRRYRTSEGGGPSPAMKTSVYAFVRGWVKCKEHLRP